MERKAQTYQMDKDFIVSIFSALIITLFLFYIDEGYYNFKWMLSTGNWVVFFIYFPIILAGQLIILKLLLRKLSGTIKYSLGIFLGSAISLYMLINVVF